MHQSKRILKTAYCPNNTAPAQTMAFEFISDYNGLSWKRLRIVAKRGAAEVSSPALLKKKSSMQAWAKDIGGGGIQKLGTEF